MSDTEGRPAGLLPMAIVRWGLVLVAAVGAFASVGWYFGWFRGGSESARTSTIYYCPMHPGVQQDHPGECPICSMTLVPKPKDAPATAAAPASQPAAQKVPGLVPVDLNPERVQLMGMRTAPVAREALSSELRTAGSVAANEKGLAVIQTRFSGYVEQLLVDQTGQKVTRGQVLATIYSPDLLAAQQEFLNAVRWAKAPEQGMGLSAGLKDDARHRLELLGISRPEIENLERTGEPVRALPIRSPVGGYVIEKDVVQGAAVQPGMTLFRLADLSTVWVLAEVDQVQAGRMKVGGKAIFEPADSSGPKVPGKVTFIYPTLDPDTRTLRVRLELPNKDLALKPGSGIL